MAYLNKDDLTTHIYPEIIEEIIRGNDTLADRAINAAVSEAKSYLGRFDWGLLFPDDGGGDEFLKNLVKDIACWHLVKLANPNINLELFRTVYEDAIKFLEKVMIGKPAPEQWPLRQDDPDTPFDESGHIGWSSNRKRNNHY